MSKLLVDFSAAHDRSSIFMHASDEFLHTLRLLNNKSKTPDAVEPQIKIAFLKFLRDMDMPLAEKNFAALLSEKSGAKARRDDGSVNWFHELVPMIMVIEMARLGRKKGGLDLKDLAEHGGLEVLLCTHMRHDSVEDFTSQRKLAYELKRMVAEIRQNRPDIDPQLLESQSRQILINTSLMTQKKVKLLPADPALKHRCYKNKQGDLVEVEENAKIYQNPDGEYVKEDVTEYTGEMVFGKRANPIVFLLKQLDVVHNFSTMFSPKFTPDRRLKRCNEREDMYGGRSAFPEHAMQKWPKFAQAFITADAFMGCMMFTHFRLLQDVDRLYKMPNRFPVGLIKYRDNMFKLPMVNFLDPRQSLVNNILNLRNRRPDDTEYQTRLAHFIQHKFIPGLGKYISRFPQLSPAKKGELPFPAPHAAP